MNNIDRSKLLFKASGECVEHANSSLSRKSWNMAIRRAQEAVEIELTGMLALIGVHYPKDHDQAPLLIRILKANGVEINGSDKIEEISADLSRKRGPALHQEEGYDEITANKAIADMNFVFDRCKDIREKLLQKDK